MHYKLNKKKYKRIVMPFGCIVFKLDSNNNLMNGQKYILINFFFKTFLYLYFLI